MIIVSLKKDKMGKNKVGKGEKCWLKTGRNVYLNVILTPNTKGWSTHFSPNMNTLPASALLTNSVNLSPTQRIMEAPHKVFRMIRAKMNCKDMPQKTVCQFTCETVYVAEK